MAPASRTVRRAWLEIPINDFFGIFYFRQNKPKTPRAMGFGSKRYETINEMNKQKHTVTYKTLTHTICTHGTR